MHCYSSYHSSHGHSPFILFRFLSVAITTSVTVRVVVSILSRCSEILPFVGPLEQCKGEPRLVPSCEDPMTAST